MVPANFKKSIEVPSLWQHIDGHHSLIQWRFVIQKGIIDGFSQIIENVPPTIALQRL